METNNSAAAAKDFEVILVTRGNVHQFDDFAQEALERNYNPDFETYIVYNHTTSATFYRAYRNPYTGAYMAERSDGCFVTEGSLLKAILKVEMQETSFKEMHHSLPSLLTALINFEDGGK